MLALHQESRLPATWLVRATGLLFVLLSCLFCRAANHQILSAPPGVVESGVPSFVIYGAESLGLSSAPSDLKRLPDGRILVVSQQELAIGDGVRWELIRHADGDIRFINEHVAVSEDGRLYAGVRDGISHIRLDEDGHWRFGDTLQMKSAEGKTLPVLTRTARIGSQWYWHAGSGQLIRWNPGEPPVAVGHLDSIGCLFRLRDTVYVASGNTGDLMRLTPTGLVPALARKESSINQRVVTAVPFDRESVLVATTNAGIHLFDGGRLLPLATTGLLAGGRGITDLCAMGEDYFAASIHAYGIVIFHRSGRVVQVIDKPIDHRFANVRSLHYTPEGVLWALLGNGVARISFPNRLSDYNPLIPLGQNFVEPCRFEGRLWMLANGHLMQGVYDTYGRLTEFADASPENLDVWRLHTESGRLLVSTDQGLMARKDGGYVMLVPGLCKAVISPRRGPDGRFPYLAKGEIGWINLDLETPQLERTNVPGLGNVFSCDPDSSGNLWCELGSSRIARLRTRDGRLSIDFYDSSHGLPDGWIAIFVLDGVARMNAANRTLVLDENSGRFVDDRELLKKIPILETASSRPFRDLSGRIWMPGQDSIKLIDDSVSPARVLPTEIPPHIRPFDFTQESGGVIWMHDNSNFARYDPNLPSTPTPPIKAIITRIELPESGRTLFTPRNTLPTLPYADNSLIAHFASPVNPFCQPVTFEVRLDGLGKDWISTGVSGLASFNRLREGQYSLRVRAKSLDQVGPEVLLSFTISPPWFRTPLAYASYALGGILALAAAVLLPILDERRQKQRLEQLVAERTRELRGSEERYRLLSQELEQRVAQRTEELNIRVSEVERLNADLDRSTTSLQAANNELLAANQELEAFSYSVSHDLRAPLRNVTGFIEILRKRVYGKSDKESDRYLDIVITEAKRLGDLIDELLAFSRIGRAEMKLQPIDMNVLVEQVRSELAMDTRDRNLEWRIHSMPKVLGDHFLLRQVMANLLSNAVKFTQKREHAVIEIGHTPQDGGGGMGVFWVKDNGAGFNPLYTDKLFKVFQRLHANRDFEGTGIGLANVKRIISRHGGQVWAEGETDKGASFYFTIKTAP